MAEETIFPKTRAELVEFVRSVIGEHRKATEQTYRLRCSRGIRSLEVAFALHSQTLFTYTIPIPDEALAVIEDEEQNPYDRLEASVLPVSARVASMALAPMHATIDPHPFVGRPDRMCEACGMPDRDTVHKGKA